MLVEFENERQYSGPIDPIFVMQTKKITRFLSSDVYLLQKLIPSFQKLLHKMRFLFEQQVPALENLILGLNNLPKEIFFLFLVRYL